MVQYFCRINNQEQGPFNREELDYLIQRGKFGPKDVIRVGHAGKWEEATIFENSSTASSSRKNQPNILNSKVQRREKIESYEDQTSDELLSENIMSVTEAVPPILAKKRSFVLNHWLVIGAVFLLLLLIAFLIWYFYFNQTEVGNNTGTNSSGQETSSQSSNDNLQNATEGNSSQGSGSSSHSEEIPPGKSDNDTSVPDETPGHNTVPVPSQKNTKNSSSSGNHTIPSGYFFDLPAYGTRLIYVIDCSSSMAGNKMESAKQELMKSLRILNTSQQFYVVFFSDTSYPMFYPDQPADELLFATEDNIKIVGDWLNNFQPSGGTNPTDALTHVFKLEPHTVYFLTDGAFDEIIVDKIQELNTQEIVINTIGFHSQAAEALLKNIATNNSGKYRYVP